MARAARALFLAITLSVAIATAAQMAKTVNVQISKIETAMSQINSVNK